MTLDGTDSSDPDADTTLTYSWVRKSGETDNAVTLTNADKASASFTAPDDIVANATLTFVLTVSDGTVSDTDEVVITVTGENAAATFSGDLTGEVTEDDEDQGRGQRHGDRDRQRRCRHGAGADRRGRHLRDIQHQDQR